MPKSRGEAFWLPNIGLMTLVLRQEYRVSASARNFLMKNIDLYFWFSSFLNKYVLTETYDTAR